MKYIGSIQAVGGDPPISHAAWMKYIQSAKDLVRPLGRPGRNPANGERIRLRPPADTVHLIVDERPTGMFSWGPPDNACVIVESAGSSDSRVRQRAKEIAGAIGGLFTECDGDRRQT